MATHATASGVFKVNGRSHYFGRIRELTKTGKGKYEIRHVAAGLQPIFNSFDAG